MKLRLFAVFLFICYCSKLCWSFTKIRFGEHVLRYGLERHVLKTAAEVLGMTVEKLAEEMEGAGKAKTIWSLLRVGENPLEGSSPQTLEEEKLVTSGRVLSDRSKAKLISVLDVNRLIPASISSETVSDCGTRKLLLRLEDGQSIESVLIPQDYATTLCVSTQIGCDRGCAFCATGTMGLIRNLTASEIIAQVMKYIRCLPSPHHLTSKITHLPPKYLLRW